MNNFDIKQPESFESYNRWKELQTCVMEYRNQIKEYKNKLSELTDKLPQLRKASKRAYDKSDSNISEINSTDKALNDCKAEIKQVKKDWAKTEQDLKDHKVKIQEAKLKFLKDAAPYVNDLLDEFLPVLQKAAEMKDNIKLFSQFDELRIPGIDNEAIYFWREENRNGLFEGFKERFEDITSDNFQPRELKQLKNNN